MYLKKTFSKISSKLDLIQEAPLKEGGKSKSPDMNENSLEFTAHNSSIEHTQDSLKEGTLNSTFLPNIDSIMKDNGSPDLMNEPDMKFVKVSPNY